jgi:hypothetical protein
MSADGLKGVHEDFIIRCRCAAEYEQMIDTLLALVIGATPLAVLPRIAPILLILALRRALLSLGLRGFFHAPLTPLSERR